MESMPEERRPKLSDAGGGEDRLSALHDDALIQILLKLRCLATAARTSVLCRRWRHLWALLPKLHFYNATDPRRIRSALAAHEAPALQELVVVQQDASFGPTGAWLPIAARRLSGLLFCHYLSQRVRARRRAALKLPCFESATGISMRLGFLRLTLPPSGVFARLSLLHLFQLRLHGMCELGAIVSSPRCPCLGRLVVDDVRGVGGLAIHSESLGQIELYNLPDLQQLTIVAPSLQQLKVQDCFAPVARQPVASISAPHLLQLAWIDDYDQNSVKLGEMAHLQRLDLQQFIVYRKDYIIASHNRNCALLLRRFERLHSLVITLHCPPDIANKKYLMEDITRVPDVKLLGLGITACGHSFGASLFHVLRMCTAIRRLNLGLIVAPEHEAETVCPSGCICDQPPSWKTRELVLNCLEEVEIFDLKGSEHEISVVNRLFSWAPVLKRMTVNFHYSVTENKAEELCQVLLTFSRPEICMICRMPNMSEKVLHA
ncbi:unnamed protein product [Triticum turgidum subsp. durum]|uniref:FBD domain-containing protein n=1 Tax=Triticum turgidum subsp. durum TaxID=4567 RepID=A0A9R0RET0_TRITD|nr:unnamed protein product [Triticum turgidum subsp. durum]